MAKIVYECRNGEQPPCEALCSGCSQWVNEGGYCVITDALSCLDTPEYLAVIGFGSQNEEGKSP